MDLLELVQRRPLVTVAVITKQQHLSCEGRRDRVVQPGEIPERPYCGFPVPKELNKDFSEGHAEIGQREKALR